MTKTHLITLPEFFKENGYTTAGIGKTFHTIAQFNVRSDEEYSWSVPSEIWETPYNSKREHIWFGVPGDKRHDTPLEDQRTRTRALKDLDRFTSTYRESGQPFFLMLGFKKPHLPFNLPDSFLEEYSLDDISPAEHDSPPMNYPGSLWSRMSELYDYADMSEVCSGSWKMDCKVPEETAKSMRRAYYGCVTYTDSLIGDVLDKMDELHMWNDTVVVFMADHGFHLGENGWWAKNTNWEAGLHVPLMISIPGLTTKQEKNDELVELVDVYPTLLDATGHPVPELCPEKTSSEVQFCREGNSLLPLIRKDSGLQWKRSAFSQSIYPLFSENPKYKGYSMRTRRFRYTEWVDYSEGYPHDWPEPFAVELYDLEKDPNQLVNKSKDPRYKSIEEILSRILRNGWKDAQPKYR